MLNLLFGIGAILLGIYGFRNPERGRAWGSAELWKENQKDAKAYTVRMNQTLSALIMLAGLTLIVAPHIR